MTEKELLSNIINDNVRIGGSWILYEKGIIPYEDVDDIDVYMPTTSNTVDSNMNNLMNLGYIIKYTRDGKRYYHPEYLNNKIIHIHMCPIEDFEKCSDLEYILECKLNRIVTDFYSNIEILNGKIERDSKHCKAIVESSEYKNR